MPIAVKPFMDLSHTYYSGEVVGVVDNEYYNVKLKDSPYIVSARLSSYLKKYLKLKVIVGDTIYLYSENGENVIAHRDIFRKLTGEHNNGI